MMKERTAYDNLPAKQLCLEVLRNTGDLLSDPQPASPVQDRTASEYT
jgi:hypothetical protein